MKKRMIWRILCILLVAALLISTTAAQELPNAVGLLEAVAESRGGTLQRLFRADLLTPGDPASDWIAFAAGRVGVSTDYDRYLDQLAAHVTQQYQQNGYLDRNKATEWHRIALTVLALGGDPSAFGTDANGNPIDLVAAGTYNWQQTGSLGQQGLNAWIFALITLDAMHYQVPEDAAYDRETILQEILSVQTPEGGFGLSAGSADVDVTAMALQALAPYQDRADVQDAMTAALDYLSAAQTAQGSFSVGAESCAQVVTALCALGIDPRTDSRFCKEGGSVVDGMLLFQTSSGLYTHLLDGEDNWYATGQVALAWAALARLESGYRPLYDLRPEGAEGEKITGGNGTVTHLYPEPEAQFPTIWIVCGAVVLLAGGDIFLIRKKRRV